MPHHVLSGGGPGLVQVLGSGATARYPDGGVAYALANADGSLVNQARPLACAALSCRDRLSEKSVALSLCCALLLTARALQSLRWCHRADCTLCSPLTPFCCVRVADT